ncbi:MAG: hypothetical protein ACTSSG_14370 [Candidatus Heimdallarchaeaceae archaeon]
MFGLAYTQLIIAIINIIILIALLYFINEVLKLLTNPADLDSFFEFLFNAYNTILFLLTILIIQFVVQIVNYVFYFFLASSFNNFANIEVKITENAIKASGLMIFGLILDICYQIVAFFLKLFLFI